MPYEALVVSAQGIESICLCISKSLTLSLDNVLYISSATAHLISVASLFNSTNHYAIFNKDSASIHNSSGTLMAMGTVNKNKKIYCLNASHLLIEHSAYAAVSPTKSTFSSSSTAHTPAPLCSHCVPTLDIWHWHLAHANLRLGYKQAISEAVEGMPINLSIDLACCNAYIKGKQIKSSVPSTREGVKAMRTLEKIYVDVCGLHVVESASGNYYSLDIFDSCTNFVWTYPIKKKLQAFDLVKEFTLGIHSKDWEETTIQIQHVLHQQQ
jgi:hypothetical protein